MLTSIDVKFIFDSACLSASLGDKAGLFSCANILQIADVVHWVVFLLLLLCYLGNKSPICPYPKHLYYFFLQDYKNFMEKILHF